MTAPSAKLSTGAEVGFGTQLPLVGRSGGSLVVLTPAGATAKLPAAAAKPLPRTRADLVRSAKQFLGLKYLWGGLSAWGYDCSGLTWAVYRAHGITIPRDADAQATRRPADSLEDAKPGDLIFYGTSFVHHVTMYVGRGHDDRGAELGQRGADRPDPHGRLRRRARRFSDASRRYSTPVPS